MRGFIIMDFVDLQIVKMSTKVLTPTRATNHSVGLDFYSPSDCLIYPLSQVQMPAQIKISVPLGHYGRLASKSGLAMKHQIHVGAGVIDPDYIEEGKVLLLNAGRHYYLIKRGDPIAQLILEKVSLPILTRVDEFPPTNRGEKGCGSHSVNIFQKS